MDKVVFHSDMRLLGIDYGRKRIGFALAHPDWLLVTPLQTLTYQKFADIEARLKTIQRDYEPDGIVIGLPLNADGTEGPRCQASRDFAALLSTKTKLPIVLFDERRSSLAADERGATRENRDALAAQVILEDYIAAHPYS